MEDLEKRTTIQVAVFIGVRTAAVVLEKKEEQAVASATLTEETEKFTILDTVQIIALITRRGMRVRVLGILIPYRTTGPLAINLEDITGVVGEV